MEKHAANNLFWRETNFIVLSVKKACFEFVEADQ